MPSTAISCIGPSGQWPCRLRWIRHDPARSRNRGTGLIAVRVTLTKHSRTASDWLFLFRHAEANVACGLFGCVLSASRAGRAVQVHPLIKSGVYVTAHVTGLSRALAL